MSETSEINTAHGVVASPEAVDGSAANKRALRTLVFAVPTDRETIQKGDEGKSMRESSDPFEGQYGVGRVIGPPIDLLALAMIEEHCGELGKCFEAYETNIEGFGGRLMRREMPRDIQEATKDDAKGERRELMLLLERPNPDDTFTQLRKKIRHDREATGNAYVEMVPLDGKVVSLNHVESHTMRISKQDDIPTLMETKVVDPETGEVVTRMFYKRFRRYVQERYGRFVFFKEWGDPRIVDSLNGTTYVSEAAAIAARVPKERWANPMKHFRHYCARSPYGLPRYIGNLFSVYGSRASEEINFKTLKNNAIPNLVVMVSGGAMLTEGSIRRLEDFVNSQIKQTDNYSKILLLEAEQADEAAPAGGSAARIELKPLKDVQHDDQLFQNYDKNNRDKIRESFRLPPLLIGRSDNINKATAEASRKLAEEQVFAPERNESDAEWSQLFLEMGFSLWVYRSFSPNVTDAKDLVDVLANTEKTGGITPNMARRILEDILNRPLPPYNRDAVPFDPDVPFSLTMAEAVKGIAAAGGSAAASLGGNTQSGRNALAPNQGQIPAAPAPGTPAPAPAKNQPIGGAFTGLPGPPGHDFSPENVTAVADYIDTFLDNMTGYNQGPAPRRRTRDSAPPEQDGNTPPQGG